jgi:antitoxin (DNA-binding transcriptional repressor) of toxin-antitoxin stability system
MTHHVSAREANQHFSDILARAARGESVVITWRGEPVAELVKFGAGGMADDHNAAWDRLMSLLETNLNLGGAPVDRDALYDR